MSSRQLVDDDFLKVCAAETDEESEDTSIASSQLRTKSTVPPPTSFGPALDVSVSSIWSATPWFFGGMLCGFAPAATLARETQHR